MGRPVRRGFTLIELLVVIAIIGVLIALLLPALQSVRESSRRTKCSNTLKQIGIALYNYHDSKKLFPPGNVMIEDPIGEAPRDTPSKTGWTIEILPYIEDQSLFLLYNPHATIGDPSNQVFRESPAAIYTCPSDLEAILETPEAGPEAGYDTMTQPPRLWRTGSYRGMAGRSDGPTMWDTNENSGKPRSWRGVLHVVGSANMVQESTRTISDGTANSLMVGEQTVVDFPKRRTFWAHTWAGFISSNATPQPRVWLGDYQKCVAVGGNGNEQPCRRAWYSMHPGGMNFLFCDGRIRWIEFDTDQELFADLASIAGGEIASLPID